MKYYALIFAKDTKVNEFYIEPVIIKNETEIENIKVRRIWGKVFTTTYYKTKDEAFNAISLYQGKKDHITYDLENICIENADKLPTAQNIRAFMQLYDTTYSMAVLRLLCIKYPELIVQTYKSEKEFLQFYTRYKDKQFTYLDLIADGRTQIFNNLNDIFDVPVEVLIQTEEDFFNNKPSMEEFIDVYLKVNPEVFDKFSNIEEDKKEFYINRYASINCAILLAGEKSLSKFFESNGISRQMASKFLLAPYDMTEEFICKVETLLLKLNKNLKVYL